MEKQEFALESFKNIQQLIQFTDQKSGAILVVSGLVLTVFLEFSKNLVFRSISFGSIVIFIFGFTTAFLLVYTIYLSIFKILRPRLAKHYHVNELSLIYFNHLAKISDREEIFQKFKNLNDDIILKNITDQIFEVSRILDAKITELHNCINYLFFAIASLLIFILTLRLV